MRRGSLQYGMLGIAFALALSACGTGDANSLSNQGTTSTDPNGGTTNGDVNGTNGGTTQGTGTTGGTSTAAPAATQTPVLDTRVTDYGEALRIASLKLVGDLPTLTQINAIATAANAAAAQTVYEADIDAMLTDPRFQVQMIQWWRDTLKTGGAAPVKGNPSYDTAATFAAEVVLNDRPLTDIFTATTNTCPTFTPGTGTTLGTFTDASCTNTAPTAGLLTDPGIMSNYFANMSFRRVRFIQETFVCSKMPAELSATPVTMGAGAYTSPWPFTSITGGTAAKINFQDTSATICANCHTTLNHIAPLFGFFDSNGLYSAGKYEVLVPVPGDPTATLADWLPAGQGFGWRYNVPVTDIPSLGAAIAKDPTVATCAVNRVWNWAMSRGDIVNDLATVPLDVTASYTTDFTTGGYKLKATIAAMFKSDDFVKF